MKNNNGFTLIELLAVIVILAIVTVIATRSILPFMSSARIDAFGIEATDVVESTNDAIDLYNLNKIKLNGNKSCVKNKVFCFTVEELIDLGIYEGSKETYKGKIIVDTSNASSSKYTVYIQKGAEFKIVGKSETDYVNNKDGNIEEGGFNDSEAAEYTTCTCE